MSSTKKLFLSSVSSFKEKKSLLTKKLMCYSNPTSVGTWMNELKNFTFLKIFFCPFRHTRRKTFNPSKSTDITHMYKKKLHNIGVLYIHIFYFVTERFSIVHQPTMRKATIFTVCLPRRQGRDREGGKSLKVFQKNTFNKIEQLLRVSTPTITDIILAVVVLFVEYEILCWYVKKYMYINI